MSPEFAPYVIVAWMVAMVAAFPSLPPHRAILLIVLSGTLFLPEAVAGVVELGPVKLGKYAAISYTALLAAALYDSGTLFAGSLRRIDAPMLAWCLWPVPSVLLNDPPPDGGSYFRDAFSQTLGSVVTWGVPYLLGRVYFGRREAVRDLAVGVVVAAAVYVPLCLWESRMSPTLHYTVYGYAQHQFIQTVRFGGYRPMVFMPHGLYLGMFMVTAAVLAVWLRRPLGLPGYLLLLVPVAVLMRSTGALALGVAGGAVLGLAGRPAARWAVLLLVAVPPGYVVARTTGLWSGADLVEATEAGIESDRAQSLAFRLYHEDQLLRKALERPVAGWGGWGRARIRDASGRDVSVTDGLWVILLGDRGAVGLALFGAAVLLPVARFAVRSDPAGWRTPELAPAAGCAVILTLLAINNLPNVMADPLWPLIAGVLAGFTPDAPSHPVDQNSPWPDDHGRGTRLLAARL